MKARCVKLASSLGNAKTLAAAGKLRLELFHLLLHCHRDTTDTTHIPPQPPTMRASIIRRAGYISTDFPRVDRLTSQDEYPMADLTRAASTSPASTAPTTSPTGSECIRPTTASGNGTRCVGMMDACCHGQHNSPSPR